jgi:hypothetical protein
MGGSSENVLVTGLVKCTVVLVDGKRLVSAEIGQIFLRYAGYKQPVMLKDVLIVPGLSRNFLLVTKLLKSKIQVTFAEIRGLFGANSKRCAHRELRNNLFVMSGKVVNNYFKAFSGKVEF